MEVRVVNTLSACPNNDPVHRFVAIELSKSNWVVGFQTPLTDNTSRHQVKAGDAKGLIELIERVRTRVGRHVSRPVEIVSCYEAGYDGFWLHRVLEAHGIHNHVLDPASLQVSLAGTATEDGSDRCQSASKFDPPSASNFDPLERRGRAVALAPSELAGVAETARARVGM